MTKYLISIVGPTAIGKTALSIALAKYFNTEIISSDSRQFYKEMQIGTAVPIQEELDAAKHYFIQHKSIHQNYTVGDFEKDALSKINSIHKKNNIAIMVGGSGLFVKAVTEGLDDFPEIDKSIRTSLNTQYLKSGLKPLQNQLKQMDPVSFNNIAVDNPKRVIRALEICIGTKTPYSSFLNITKKKRDFKTLSIGLTAERPIIYERINQRVDIMIKNGLLEEAKKLFPYKHLNALNTVGYKELFLFFDGKISLEGAIAEIKKNTRRFAKRQLTWFKKDETTAWFNYESSLQDIIDHLNKALKKPIS